MRRDLDDTSVTVGSGNVFADLGVPDPDIAQAKAHLVIRIAEIIRERGLTQNQAAKLLGITQPKVSEVIRGRSDYTMERLMSFLSRLGQQVTIDLGSAVVAAGRKASAAGVGSATKKVAEGKIMKMGGTIEIRVGGIRVLKRALKPRAPGRHS